MDQREVLDLMIEADSYLSLLWYRYVDKDRVPQDLALEVQNLIGRLRTAEKLLETEKVE